MFDLQGWVEAILLLYAALTTIAALTPTDKDDKALGRIKNLMDIIRRIKR